MHVMGKVGVWLVVIAAAAGTLLTAKLVQVRNSWTRKSVAFQQQYQTLKPKVAELKEQLARLESEYFQSQELWGKYLSDVTTTMQRPAEGVVAIDRGTNHGIRENMSMYGFEILPDGSTVYRGDFTVITARDVVAQLQPNWAIRPEDVQTWQQNGKWRWRIVLPPSYQPGFDNQNAAIIKADDVLAERRTKLAKETALEKVNQDQLALREAELVGGAPLSKDPEVEVEFRDGLVAAVEQAEEERNQVLLKVDNLRRQLRATQREVERLRTDNIEQSRKLPQPATTVGSTKD
jgi:hypothetical protein